MIGKGGLVGIFVPQSFEAAFNPVNCKYHAVFLCGQTQVYADQLISILFRQRQPSKLSRLL